MTRIVSDEDYSRGAPTLEGTGIRVINVACAYEQRLLSRRDSRILPFAHA